MFLCNVRLSILGMGDAPAFVIKGDVCAFMMGEGMGDAPTFVIKGDVCAFVMGEGMGDMPLL
jgi:hypothetical protein